MIAKDSWNNGYATVISNGFFDYGFGKLKLEKIVVSIVPKNEASNKVLQKLGMNKMVNQPESSAIYFEKTPTCNDLFLVAGSICGVKKRKLSIKCKKEPGNRLIAPWTKDGSRVSYRR